MAKKSSVTIVDVAKAAGVSVSTVSRVLNDKGDVSEETYQHVRGIIDELGYSSSLAAKSMRSHSTNVIGLIMPDVEDPYSIEVMRGVNRGIIELDYDLLIYTNGDIQKKLTAVREQQYVSLLNNSITDGVIIVTPLTNVFSSASPVVSIDPSISDPSGPAVMSTNFNGAFEITNYLIGLGHTRIGYISGRKDLQSSIRRQRGYESALTQAGLGLDPTLIAEGDFREKTAITCATQLLSLDNPPTAIFAANDQSAKGVYKAADTLGYRIPEDISLVGFDNIPEAKYLKLTTVDQSIEQMGYIGTKMLFDLIQGEPLESEIHKVETRLVIRDSCKARE